MNSLLLSVTAALGATWLAFAPASDQLKRERLPADVDFVVHLDVEGLRQTQLWKHLEQELEGEDVDLGDLDDFRTRYGIDPLTDVRAVTLFKIKDEEDPTVVLFSTTKKVDTALHAFQLESGYQNMVENGIELHTWDAPKGFDNGEADAVYAYVHTGTGDERVIVLASKKESAVHAARVLRGEEPNHARSGTLLTLAPAPGSFLYVAATEIPHLDDFTPASQAFGLAQGIQVDLGEAGGFLRAHMGVMTKSAEDALNVSNVVNGLVSLARLAGSGAGEALELLTGIRLNTRGSEVMLDFEFGVERLIELLTALDENDEADEVDEDVLVEIK